ncbi:MAG: tetratricopeptide repeat protein [Actinobacteria bacterium]|nr:tetratricopeptide repeat protein [Actinomycetota bacterium]
MTVPGDHNAIEKELTEARRQIEEYGRSGWIVQEQLGRALRALGRHEEAEPHLRRVLEDRPEPREHWEWMAIGAIHRLLGEHELAASSWNKAIGTLEAPNETERGDLVEAHFLLGNDQQAIDVSNEIEASYRGRARAVADLARARRNRDAALAAEVADRFAEQIRRKRAKVSATGMVSLHDWYEIATELRDELAGGSA